MKYRRIIIYFLSIVLIAIIFFAWAQFPANSGDRINLTTYRNKYLWPFSWNSIWNLSLGSKARYLPANIEPAYAVTPEINFFIVTSDRDPVVDWYSPQNWGVGRCQPGGKLLGKIHFPDDLVIPDATKTHTPNNVAAILHPDGHTLIQINPLARCQAGGAVFGYGTDTEDITGKGISGGQGGSGMSSIGGTIRLRELLPTTTPIRHALKVKLWGYKHLYHNPPGYRWPADRADGYAFDDDSDDKYGGSNPKLVMGSLLAIPPLITPASLKLQTIPGQKIFYALQNYGGYIVDDSAWNSHAIAIEKGVDEEFRAIYGYDFYSTRDRPTPFYQDINKIFQTLQIVDNNTPDNVGGGGRRRQPLAPKFRDLQPNNIKPSPFRKL